MSIKIKALAYIAYPVTDVARARNFYGRTLKLKEDSAHELGGGVWWIEYDVDGVALAITNEWTVAKKRPHPAAGANLALEVADLDAALADINAAKVPVILPVQETPVCRFFAITDPDGNPITLHKCK